MTPPNKTPAWNDRSVVTACPTCEGRGVVRAHRCATIDDPYPETDCECGMGEHDPYCEVCGFTRIVKGFDCLACDTVNSIFSDDLARLDVAAFAKAFEVARAAALKLNEGIRAIDPATIISEHQAKASGASIDVGEGA